MPLFNDRKNLGLLEGEVLMAMSGFARRGEEVRAVDLFVLLNERGKRRLTIPGMYALLENLERKELIQSESRIGQDTRGVTRQLKIYALTEAGATAASTEYEARTGFMQWVHAALAFLGGTIAHA